MTATGSTPHSPGGTTTARQEGLPQRLSAGRFSPERRRAHRARPGYVRRGPPRREPTVDAGSEARCASGGPPGERGDRGRSCRPPGLRADAAACTGNQVIQQAPYTCEGTKTDQGITVNAVLSVDAAGRAQADYTLPLAANVPVAIALHSWIGIDTGPDIVVTGSIPAGSRPASS